jgi:hypothetical protein
MSRPIRTMTALLLLAVAFLALRPQPLLAGDRRRIDFAKYQPPQVPFADTTVTTPASTGKAGWSTAKKTWLIIGIVVGAGAIAYAVSNHSSHSGSGGSSGGGGGGGY